MMDDYISPEDLKKANARYHADLVIKHDFNLSRAAGEAGVSPAKLKNELKSNPYLQDFLMPYIEALEAQGATDTASAKLIADAMKATKDGEPDHVTRLRANDQYLKIKRYLTDDKVIIDQSKNIVNVGLSQSEIDLRVAKAIEAINGRA